MAPADPQHLEWMGLALEEARRALATEDVPIGAVVIGPDGAVLGSGRNEREALGDPTAHAEVVAIREAAARLRERSAQHGGPGDGWRLEDCTLVVTLEPCAMCAGAIVLGRVPRVVYAAADPKAGAAGSVLDVLGEPALNHHPEVAGGLLAEEAAQILREFFGLRRK
jgi:tRNA(adenine34) deaminase